MPGSAPAPESMGHRSRAPAGLRAAPGHPGDPSVKDVSQRLGQSEEERDQTSSQVRRVQPGETFHLLPTFLLTDRQSRPSNPTTARDAHSSLGPAARDGRGSGQSPASAAPTRGPAVTPTQYTQPAGSFVGPG